MQRVEKMMLVLLCMVLMAGVCSAQTQQAEPAEPSANVISGTVAAIGYPVGGGGTKVTMVATPAAPQTSGEARVDAKVGGTQVSLKVAGMPQPTVLGAEFLTYVLWTVTPDGTTTNLGEIPIDKTGQGKLDVDCAIADLCVDRYRRTVLRSSYPQRTRRAGQRNPQKYQGQNLSRQQLQTDAAQ